MGFFSDLKEDLSQAVNELMPEEELKKELEALLADETLRWQKISEQVAEVKKRFGQN